eukprot:COSAG01_NODE_15935_length_1285_cov_1.105396_1_plen_43_part_10
MKAPQPEKVGWGALSLPASLGGLWAALPRALACANSAQPPSGK